MAKHAHLHKSVLIQLFKLRMDLLNHSIRNNWCENYSFCLCSLATTTMFVYVVFYACGQTMYTGRLSTYNLDWILAFVPRSNPKISMYQLKRISFNVQTSICSCLLHEERKRRGNNECHEANKRKTSENVLMFQLEFFAFKWQSINFWS